jgi:hypothetical protein
LKSFILFSIFHAQPKIGNFGCDTLSEPEVPEVLHAPAKEGRTPLANEQPMARVGHVAALSLPPCLAATLSCSSQPIVRASSRARPVPGGAWRWG